MIFWIFGTTTPPLWAIYAGQLMIALITVVCFFLILRRLNEHLQKTLQLVVDMMVQQQKLTKLMSDELTTHIKSELQAAKQANHKLDMLMRERAIER